MLAVFSRVKSLTSSLGLRSLSAAVATKTKTTGKVVPPKVTKDENVNVRDLNLNQLPLKPKRPPNAFNQYCKEHFESFRTSGEKFAVGALTSKCSEGWKSLSVAEKAKYAQKMTKEIALYKKEKEAYDSVMKQKITIEKMVDVLKNHTKQSKKDAVANRAPRAPGAYNIFVKEQFSSRKTSLGAVADAWNSLNENEKNHYREKSAQIKKALNN